MFFVVYKITNLINNKIYVGVHQTENIHDGYFGSGVALKKAVSKYGKESFSKEITHICDTKEQMFEIERSIVTEEFINRQDTYNCKVGGHGGWDHTAKQGSNKWWKGKHRSEETKELLRKLNVGKTLSKDHRDKLSAAALKNTGQKHNQYGTVWVHSLELKCNKKANKEDIQRWIDDGWIVGRKMKF